MLIQSLIPNACSGRALGDFLGLASFAPKSWFSKPGRFAARPVRLGELGPFARRSHWSKAGRALDWGLPDWVRLPPFAGFPGITLPQPNCQRPVDHVGPTFNLLRATRHGRNPGGVSPNTGSASRSSSSQAPRSRGPNRRMETASPSSRSAGVRRDRGRQDGDRAVFFKAVRLCS